MTVLIEPIDFKKIVKDTVTYMYQNPDTSRDEGIAWIANEFGMEISNVLLFFSAINDHIVASEKIPAPGGWDLFIADIQANGLEASLQWMNTFIFVPTFLERPQIKEAMLRENLRQLQQNITDVDALLVVADAMTGDSEGEEQIIALGKNVVLNQKQFLQIAITSVNSQLANL